MSRKTISDAALTPQSLEDVDAILAKLATLKRDIAILDVDLSEKVDALKLQYAAQVEPIKAQVKAHEAGIAAYLKLNKKELFATKKTLALNFGTVGFRQTTKLNVLDRTWTWERVLSGLMEKGKMELVRTKHEVDKEALRALHPSALAGYGVKLQVTDTPGYDLYDVEKEEV